VSMSAGVKDSQPLKPVGAAILIFRA